MDPISAIGLITGLIGGLAQRFADHKKEQLSLESLKLQNDHELAMRKADSEMLEKEYGARVYEASAEAATKERVASYNLDPVMYSAGNQNKWFIFLDFIRGLVRPGLTAFLVFSCVVMYFLNLKIANDNGMMNPVDAIDLVKDMQGMLKFAAESCVGWYFASRPPAKK